jgi:hypothetical protein
MDKTTTMPKDIKTKRNKKKDKKRKTRDKYGKNTPKGLRIKQNKQQITAAKNKAQ